jgi:hypothetical protein
VLPWDAKTIFVNPPYGEVRARWIDRCLLESAGAVRIVLLMPADVDEMLVGKLAAILTLAWTRAVEQALFERRDDKNQTPAECIGEFLVDF